MLAPLYKQMNFEICIRIRVMSTVCPVEVSPASRLQCMAVFHEHSGMNRCIVKSVCENLESLDRAGASAALAE